MFVEEILSVNNDLRSKYYKNLNNLLIQLIPIIKFSTSDNSFRLL